MRIASNLSRKRLHSHLRYVSCCTLLLCISSLSAGGSDVLEAKYASSILSLSGPAAEIVDDKHHQGRAGSRRCPPDEKDIDCLRNRELPSIKRANDIIAPRSPCDLQEEDDVKAELLRRCFAELAGRLGPLRRYRLNYDLGAFKNLGVTALFPTAFLTRIDVDLSKLPDSMSPGSPYPWTPVALAVHEKSSALPFKGSFDTSGQCSLSMVGGRYDPGLACGSGGSQLCDELSIPPFDYLTGRRKKGTNYECHPSLYFIRPFSCQSGDFSGKFGLARDASFWPLAVDLRLVTVDDHADNPCFIGEQMLPLVIRSSSTGRTLACAPFRVLGSDPEELLPTLELLVEEALSAIPLQAKSFEISGALRVFKALLKRIKFIEDFVEMGRIPSTSTTTASPIFTTRWAYTTTAAFPKTTRPNYELPTRPGLPSPTPGPLPPPPRRRRRRPWMADQNKEAAKPKVETELLNDGGNETKEVLNDK